MYRPIVILVAGFLLTGCAQASGVLDTVLTYKDKITDKTIEGTLIGAKTYCRTQTQEERTANRAAFVSQADADPSTVGLRVEIKCPGE